MQRSGGRLGWPAVLTWNLTYGLGGGGWVYSFCCVGRALPALAGAEGGARLRLRQKSRGPGVRTHVHSSSHSMCLGSQAARRCDVSIARHEPCAPSPAERGPSLRCARCPPPVPPQAGQAHALPLHPPRQDWQPAGRQRGLQPRHRGKWEPPHLTIHPPHPTHMCIHTPHPQETTAGAGGGLPMQLLCWSPASGSGMLPREFKEPPPHPSACSLQGCLRGLLAG